MQTVEALVHKDGKKAHTHVTRIDPKAFGLTCGALWGVGLFCMTWWIIAFDGASRQRTPIGRVYRGYTISPRGSLVGLVWAFFDGLSGGFCLAWLYNRLAGCRKPE
jgi:hypothetical protein